MLVKKELKKFRNYPLFEPLFYIGKSKNVRRYRRIRKRLEKKDRAFAEGQPELIPLHKKLNELNKMQIEEWDSIVYCDGYFYQGYNRIGISGIKPTKKRVNNYGIKKYFDQDKIALDIGSNAGFLSCYLSDYFKKVDGIELNPFLIRMGRATKNFLKKENISFINDDFVKYKFKSQYDVVFSLSNHHTIDGNLKMNFESYIQKIFHITNNGGLLFFESHNIHGNDSDLNEKFKIASKYFDLENHKMVKAFNKADVDKLFAIFRRRNEIGEVRSIDFKIEEAKNRYNYHSCYN